MKARIRQFFLDYDLRFWMMLLVAAYAVEQARVATREEETVMPIAGIGVCQELPQGPLGLKYYNPETGEIQDTRP